MNKYLKQTNEGAIFKCVQYMAEQGKFKLRRFQDQYGIKLAEDSSQAEQTFDDADMMVQFKIVDDEEAMEIINRENVLQLRYQTEKIEDTYFCTPLMVEPNWVNFDDYTVQVNNATGGISSITNKTYGPVVYIAKELNQSNYLVES